MLINAQWQNVVSNYTLNNLSDNSWTNSSYLLNTKGWNTQVVDGFEVKILKSSVPATVGIDYIELTIQYMPNLNTVNSSVQFSTSALISFMVLGVLGLFSFLGLIVFVFVFVYRDRKKHSFNSRYSSFNNPISHEQTLNKNKSVSDFEYDQYSQTGLLYVDNSTSQQSDRYCNNCGTRVGPSDRYCYSCGKNLNT